MRVSGGALTHRRVGRRQTPLGRRDSAGAPIEGVTLLPQCLVPATVRRHASSTPPSPVVPHQLSDACLHAGLTARRNAAHAVGDDGARHLSVDHLRNPDHTSAIEGGPGRSHVRWHRGLWVRARTLL